MDKIAHLTQHLRHLLARPKVQKTEGIAPERDWKMVLGVTTVVFVCSLLYAGYLYREVSKGEIFVQPERTTGALETIDVATLEATIDGLKARDIQFAELKRVKPSIVDPSL